MNGTVPSDERVELRDVWLGPCARDFARTYLTDQESRAYADLENQKRVDLPWPLVVGTAARNKQLKSIHEAIRDTLNDEHNRHVADIIRISENTDTALHVLSELPSDSMTADDLSDLSEGVGPAMSPEEATALFDWASHLGVVCNDEKGYRLDSTYAEALRRVDWG